MEWNVIASFSSSLVALLLGLGLIEKWKNKCLGPRLGLFWNEFPPCLHQIEIRHIENGVEIKPAFAKHAYQLRLKVAVANKSLARNVAIFVREIHMIEDNKKIPLENFVPGKLIWTHLRASNCPLIHGESMALCDLATIALKQKVFAGTGDHKLDRSKLEFEFKLCIEGNHGNLGSGSFILDIDLLSDETGAVPGVLKIDANLSRLQSSDVSGCSLVDVQVQLSSEYMI